ncbi:MAG: peptidoglycan-binding protein [Gammaproteobacteria bacterium]|nr:peptidoglycan-binding protein [Gammaproteobacteria bacterium]
MNQKFMKACLVTAITAALAGCATPEWGSSESTATTTVDSDQSALISEQQSKINNLEAELNAKESQLASQRASQQTTASAASSDLFPPNAEPGHCYARVLIPAQWGQTTETVLVREASERVEVIPARYETVTERVLVKEASARLETIPARYETVTERLMVRPESSRIEEVPATYKTVSEQIMVSPARTEWKRGPASSFGASVVQTSTTDTGEVMCLVETPAQYKTITRKVVDTPATTRQVTIPAEYKTIEKTVMAQPATTREITIPAEYDTIEVQKIVAPAQERRIEIPAEYDEVTKRTQQGTDKMQWREVLCQVNMTAGNIRMIQTALRDKGYDPGPIDGVLGGQTLKSANAYAKSSGLPYGSNYIAIATAEKLGVSL